MRSDTDLNDLVTHRAAWRSAISNMVSLAPDDAEYWRHELVVFDRTFSIFGEESAADIPDNLRGRLAGERAANAYRTMIAGGYKLRGDLAWIAPEGDEGMNTAERMAVVELQECGFGPVVG